MVSSAVEEHSYNEITLDYYADARIHLMCFSLSFIFQIEIHLLQCQYILDRRDILSGFQDNTV